jgi:GT2 family glycosyltransferase
VAKSQCLGFPSSKIVVQLHGPTRWTLQANDHPFTHEDQLKVDFMERECIARADLLISPSRYMVEWLHQNGWTTPPPERVQVIQNICSHLVETMRSVRSRAEQAPANEIIFFGRHEERKGIVEFCDALDVIQTALADATILITFLGGFGTIHGEDSATYLLGRSKSWAFPIRLLPDCDRTAASKYIAANNRSVVIVPSRVENSPYTVLETAILGKPLVTSAVGGSPELLDPALTPVLTCAMDRDSLSAKLLEAVRTGLPCARLAVAPATTERQWLEIHADPTSTEPVRQAKKKPLPTARTAPKVVAAVTHFQRPAKLYDAVMSLVGQLYPNLEIVVVDDGSREAESVQLLERLAPLFERLNVRLLRQPNRYLGAARNHVIAETDSEFIVFLDDDDIAFPNLVQTLVTAAEATHADIVTCINLYMPEVRRSEAHPFPDRFQQKVSYVPTGGPLSLAPLENCYGSATALIRRSVAKQVGGYTETYGVGHEDFDLYVRALQAGLRIEVCPFPLFLYEVEHASMVTNTSRLRNWSRVANAVDASKDNRAWQDLVSLTAGQRAAEHISNFAAYRLTQDTLKGATAAVHGHAIDSAEYPNRLAEHAMAVGAMTFANALRALTVARESTTVKQDTPHMMPALMVQPAPMTPRQSDTDSLMLGALIDLSLDRVGQAVDAFILTSEREPQSISNAQLRFLRTLTSTDTLTPDDAGRILNTLKRNSFNLEETIALVSVMFRLAVVARDMKVASVLVDRALVIDEQAYLAADPSVADLVARAVYRSGLDHFVRAGQVPEKSGFGLLRDIKSALNMIVSVDIPITELQNHVRSLARRQAAVADQIVTYAAVEAVDPKPKSNGMHRPAQRRISHAALVSP